MAVCKYRKTAVKNPDGSDSSEPFTGRVCEPLNGECQFVTSRYGDKCPIYHMLELRNKPQQDTQK